MPRRPGPLRPQRIPHPSHLHFPLVWPAESLWEFRCAVFLPTTPAPLLLLSFIVFLPPRSEGLRVYCRQGRSRGQCCRCSLSVPLLFAVSLISPSFFANHRTSLEILPTLPALTLCIYVQLRRIYTPLFVYLSHPIYCPTEANHIANASLCEESLE